VCTSGAFTLTCSVPIFESPSGANPTASAAGGYEVNASWGPVNVLLPRFDTQGGLYSLDSVTVTLNWTTTGTVTVDNKDINNAHSFTGAGTTAPVTVTGPAGLTIGANASTPLFDSATSTANEVIIHASDMSFTDGYDGPGVPNAPVPKAVVFVFTGGKPCDPKTQANRCVEIDTDATYIQNGAGNVAGAPAGLGAYEGNGPANLIFQATSGDVGHTGTEVGSSGFLSFGGQANVGGTIQILYTYSQNPTGEVPEPVTMVLVGSAMLGIGVVFRKRRKI
jgi:hypothetical protein